MSPTARIEKDYEKLDSGEPPRREKVILDPYDLESINIAKRLTPEQRYWYYIHRGIDNDAISPMEDGLLESVEKKFIPGKLLDAEHLQSKRQEMTEEVKADYGVALRQSILDYILLDEKERIRLCIPPMAPPYRPRVARAPVPWHDELIGTKQHIEENLFITNPVMGDLLRLFAQFERLRVVDMNVLTPAVLPMSIEDFQVILRNQCQAFKAKLLNEYVLYPIISLNLPLILTKTRCISDGYQLPRPCFSTAKTAGTQSPRTVMIPTSASVDSTVFSNLFRLSCPTNSGTLLKRH
jgi:dynein heavy chain